MARRPCEADRHPDARLIGVPGGRASLETPALIVDLPALDRNIARATAIAARGGIGLRPHVKTHKSVEIARRQIAAGALGVSCASLGEAEVMAAGGIPGVLLTSPVVTDGKLARLVALAQRSGPGGFLAVVDHPDIVDALARIARAQCGHPLDLLVDFAAGYHRTGVSSPAQAVELALRIAAEPALRLRGLQAYAGHIQHIADRCARRRAATALHEAAGKIVAAAAAHGVQFEIVTGGGTGTLEFDAGAGAFTELQPGSYVFMDADYAQSLPETAFETALFVQSAVVSVNADAWVTVDAGTKCFATDCGVPVVARGAAPASRYAFLGDQHGKLLDAHPRPALGTRIAFVTPHCDPTVNLHDLYHVVDGDTLVGLWPIDARGRH